MSGKKPPAKAKGAGMSAKVFRECVKNLHEIGIPLNDLPHLPAGWAWFIQYLDNDLGKPLAMAQLVTREYDCFVSLAPDMEPGLFSLRISTGVAPAEVVAAVLKANGLLK